MELNTPRKGRGGLGEGRRGGWYGESLRNSIGKTVGNNEAGKGNDSNQAGKLRFPYG